MLSKLKESKKLTNVCVCFRVEKAIRSLLTMIDDFPLSDPHDPSIEERMLKIRAKFKQVSTMRTPHVD